MPLRDARQAMREADAIFQSTPLPAVRLRQLRERVVGKLGGQRRRWVLAVAVAGCVATVAAVLLLRPTVSEVEDIQLAAGQRFELSLPRGVAALAAEPTLIHRDHGTLTLMSGKVLFEVERRRAGEVPVRIEVSHGAIEVLGTRFTVAQQVAKGSVTLHEGSIRFAWREGRAQLIEPGHTLEWPARPAYPPIESPREPPVELAPAPATPAPKTTTPRAVTVRKEPRVIQETDAEWLLDEVETLRSRREYIEAVRLLDKGIAGLVTPATRERFSFELGSLLTWQLNDARRACKHWRTHLAVNSSGRYSQQIQRAMEKAQCAR
jgi:transmembrane sensor